MLKKIASDYVQEMDFINQQHNPKSKDLLSRAVNWTTRGLSKRNKLREGAIEYSNQQDNVDYTSFPSMRVGYKDVKPEGKVDMGFVPFATDGTFIGFSIPKKTYMSYRDAYSDLFRRLGVPQEKIDVLLLDKVNPARKKVFSRHFGKNIEAPEDILFPAYPGDIKQYNPHNNKTITEDDFLKSARTAGSQFAIEEYNKDFRSAAGPSIGRVFLGSEHHRGTPAADEEIAHMGTLPLPLGYDAVFPWYPLDLTSDRASRLHYSIPDDAQALNRYGKNGGFFTYKSKASEALEAMHRHKALLTATYPDRSLDDIQDFEKSLPSKNQEVLNLRTPYVGDKEGFYYMEEIEGQLRSYEQRINELKKQKNPDYELIKSLTDEYNKAYHYYRTLWELADNRRSTSNINGTSTITT